MGGNVLIVAPWGNPKGWKKARYEYKGLSVLTRSSAIFLTEKAVRNNLEPRLLILAPDTLYPSFNYEEMPYSSMTNVVKETLKEEIADIVGESKGISEEAADSLRRAEIFVLPGIGSFRVRERQVEFSFEGPLSIYRNLSFLKIVLSILNLSPSRVWIDLTHGVNYLPVLTYRSFLDALEAYALIKGEDAKTLRRIYSVFNSDPFDATKGEGQRLLVHKLSGVGVEAVRPPRLDELPRLSVGKSPIGVGDNVPLERRREVAELYSEVEREILDLKERVLLTIGSIEKGAFLPIFHFSELKGLWTDILLKGIISKILTLFCSKSNEVRKEGNGLIKIKRLLKIDDEIVQLVKALSIISYVKRILEDIRESADNFATLRELRIFAERMKPLVPAPVYVMCVREYGNIARCLLKRIKEGDLREKGKLSDIIPGEEGLDKRNFIAHAGLERNVTLYRLREKPSTFKPDISIGELMRLVELTYSESKAEDVKKIVKDT
ncbi:MAG: TIGR01897 family CRISPR-associated protein [Thermoprotei archaeon]|nr:MAG: TIGR01897 family CRISPR-associated protein [Thermoprotei archaeon]